MEESNGPAMSAVDRRSLVRRVLADDAMATECRNEVMDRYNNDRIIDPDAPQLSDKIPVDESTVMTFHFKFAHFHTSCMCPFYLVTAVRRTPEASLNYFPVCQALLALTYSPLPPPFHLNGMACLHRRHFSGPSVLRQFRAWRQ
jgi:hypothetical protein